MRVREPFVRVISITWEYLVRGQAGGRSGHSLLNGGDSAAVEARRGRRNDGAHHGTDGVFHFDFLNRFVELCHTPFRFWAFYFGFLGKRNHQVEENGNRKGKRNQKNRAKGLKTHQTENLKNGRKFLKIKSNKRNRKTQTHTAPGNKILFF
jgi:hypothetical protein